MRHSVVPVFKRIMRSIGVATAALAAVLILTTVLLEGGLRLRQFAQMKIQALDAVKSLRYLLIGDSILGQLGDPSTIAYQFATDLNTRLKNAAAVTELTSPGQTLFSAQSRLMAILDRDKPRTVMIMLGKSDWSRPQSAVVTPTWFDTLQIQNVLSTVQTDLGRKIRYWLWKIDRRLAPHGFELAWDLYSYGLYRDAIPIFEHELLREPEYQRGIRALYHCYYREGLFLEGKSYLEKLATNSSETSQLLRLYALNLQFEADVKHGKESQVSEQLIRHQLDSMPISRESFKLKMRTLQNTHRPQEFYSQLEKMNAAESTLLPPVGQQALRKVIDDCLARGMRVVILQYPTDNASSLAETLSSFGEKITVLDTRVWLLTYSKPGQLLDLIDEDMEHVTKDGAKVLGQKLAEFIAESVAEGP